MRITVEIPDDFADLERLQNLIDDAVSVIGSFSAEEADELEESVQELRSTWR